MPTAAIERIRPGSMFGRGASSVIPCLEAASQDFVQGAPVQNASGYVDAIEETDGSDYIVNSDDYIVGFAEDPATGTTGTELRVYPAMPGMSFIANVYHATLASSVSAIAQIYQTYGLIQVAKTGAWRVDLAEEDTTDSVVRIIRLIDPVGTVHGRVEFVVVAAHQELFLD